METCYHSGMMQTKRRTHGGARWTTTTRCVGVSVVLGIFAGCSKSGTATLGKEVSEDSGLETSSEGWRGHLGSLRDGRADGELSHVDWGAKEPELLWKKNVGAGAASVAVSGGRLYAIGNSEGKDTVFCLDAETGDEFWSISYSCSLDKRSFEGGPVATPTLDPENGRLFVLSHQGELRCLSAEDGAERWKRHLVDDFGGRRPRWGFAGAPLLVGDRLIVEPGGEDSSVVALAPSSGETLWKSGSDEPGYAAPVAYAREGGTGLAVFNAYGLVGYEVEGGKSHFRLRWKTRYEVNAATPLYHRGHFFVCSGYGKGAGLIAVKEDDAELVYENGDAVAQFQSPVRLGDYLYLVTGDNRTKSSLTCLKFVDGSMAWSEVVGGNRGNVIAIEEYLVVVTERGEAILCDASPDGFNEHGRFQASGGRVWAAPAYSGGILFIRNNEGDLSAWDLR